MLQQGCHGQRDDQGGLADHQPGHRGVVTVQAPDVSEILERLGTDLDGQPEAVEHNDAHG
ncbi:hypothetical protein GCM10022225_84940 [Plantactinospora mayteni]